MENMYMPTINIEEVINLLECNSINKIAPLGMFLKCGVNQGIYLKIRSIKSNNFELLFLNKSYSLTKEEMIQSIKKSLNNINEDKQYYLVINEFDINYSKELINCILELMVFRYSGDFNISSNVSFILMSHKDIPNMPNTIKNKLVYFNIK